MLLLQRLQRVDQTRSPHDIIEVKHLSSLTIHNVVTGKAPSLKHISASQQHSTSQSLPETTSFQVFKSERSSMQDLIQMVCNAGRELMAETETTEQADHDVANP